MEHIFNDFLLVEMHEQNNDITVRYEQLSLRLLNCRYLLLARLDVIISCIYLFVLLSISIGCYNSYLNITEGLW